VTLTPVGRAYAEAVLDTLNALSGVTEKVSPEELAAAVSVLTFVKMRSRR